MVIVNKALVRTDGVVLEGDEKLVLGKSTITYKRGKTRVTFHRLPDGIEDVQEAVNVMREISAGLQGYVDHLSLQSASLIVKDSPVLELKKGSCILKAYYDDYKLKMLVLDGALGWGDEVIVQSDITPEFIKRFVGARWSGCL